MHAFCIVIIPLCIYKTVKHDIFGAPLRSLHLIKLKQLKGNSPLAGHQKAG